MTPALHDVRSPTVMAFDRLAAEYDVLTGGQIFRLLRERTHRRFDRCLAEGARVLEIGCGTGVDTSYLASCGRTVVACDPSEEMVTRTMRRLAHEQRAAKVIVLPCGLQDLQTYLDALTPHEPFDGIVSNFGALNCVSHLAPLGALVRRHLRPGGVVLIGLMTRLCALEAVYFTLTRRARLATRRIASGVVTVRVAGIDVPTYYHRVREVCDALGGDVALVAVEGVGVAIPPPYLESRWCALPGGVRAVVTTFDALISPWPPFNRLGDHVLLQFAKEPERG